MSVFAGILNFDDTLVEQVALRNLLTASDQHESDANIGEILDGTLGMSYSAFHTVPDSHLDQQPLRSENGCLLTWDGRLDNVADLESQLLEVNRGDHGDAALVASAFDRWGTNCFSKLRGDWSIAVWNPQNQELVLARDYVGAKQLFYSVNAYRACWCTLLKNLAYYCRPNTLCIPYLRDYLTFWPPAHLTPYQEIKSVPPGGLVRLKRGTARTEMYWHFDFARRTIYRSDGDYEEQFRFLFHQAVSRRLRARGPVLAGLSGGLDSSSVVCMADQIINKKRLTTRLDTFSYFDESESENDDQEYFTAVEKWRNRAGTHISVEQDLIPLSEENHTFRAVPGPLHNKKVRTALTTMRTQGYCVLLSGTGGDEMTAQALDPRILIADSLMGWNLRRSATQLVEWGLLMRYPLIQLLMQSSRELIPRPAHRLFRNVEQPRWIAPFLERGDHSDPQLGATWWSLTPRARDWRSTLVGLSRQLTYTSPGPQESRYPFLDQDLAEFLFSIPLQQLLRPNERRSLIRRALKGLLPPQIIARTSKARAGHSIVATIRNAWTQHGNQTLLISEMGYVDGAQFQSALENGRSSALSSQSLQLLKALSLEFWLRTAAELNIISIEKIRTPQSVRKSTSNRLAA